MIAVASAADLLRSGDCEFKAFIGLWVLHREVPIPFIDWLTERGMESQAAAAQWTLGQEGVVYAYCCTAASRLSKPFPVLLSESHAVKPERRWSWAAMKGVEISRNTVGQDYANIDLIPWLQPTDPNGYADFPTAEEALCYLLDGWEGQ